MVRHFKNRAGKMRPPGRLKLETCDYRAIKFISCATVLLFVVLSAATALGQNDSQAMIKADPNPVPFSAGKGTTTITWSTTGEAACQVYVSVDGGAEKLFAAGITGSQQAPWITPTSTYQFRLYSGTERSKLLATVTVAQGPETNKKYRPSPQLPLSPATIVFLMSGGYVLLILGAYYVLERRRTSKMKANQSRPSDED